MVSVPERSKGVDSSSTVFALVGSNPTADTSRLSEWCSVPLPNAATKGLKRGWRLLHPCWYLYAVKGRKDEDRAA